MAARSELETLDASWYENRKSALDDAIQNVIDEYEIQDRTDFPRRKTILHLLYRLKQFGNKHYEYFLRGFAEQELQETPKMPVSRALDIILRQLSFDLEVIWRSAIQRHVKDAVYQETLAQADALAHQALEFALDRQLLEPTPENDKWTVLTYLQKAATIRVIPYANVALIGVPISTLREKRDYLAIPHEVGHVVYWRRMLKSNKEYPRSVNRAYLPKPSSKDALDSWQEEIFADVFGAMVAGPVLALDFQEIEFGHEWDAFLTNDDEHPTPARRPLLYTYVLEKRGEHEIAVKLRERWLALLQQRQKHAEGQGLVHSETSGSATTNPDASMPPIPSVTPESQNEAVLAQALKEAESGVLDDLFKNKIDAALAFIPPGPKSDWSGDDFVAQLERLNENPNGSYPYVAYNRFVRELPKLSDENELDPIDVPFNLWKAWIEQQGFFSSAAGIAVQTNGKIPPGTGSDLRQPPNGTWVQVLHATGWTSDGPSESKWP